MWELLNYNTLQILLIHLLYTDILFKILLINVISLFLYYTSGPGPLEVKDRGLYKYKIFNHTWNLFLVISYISMYICFLFFIRTTYLNKEIDISIILQNLKLFYRGTTLINFSLLMGLFLLILCLLIKIHNFFQKELIKRYLVFFYKKEHISYDIDEFGRGKYIKDKSLFAYIPSLYTLASNLILKYLLARARKRNIEINTYFTNAIIKSIIFDFGTCWRYIIISFPTHFIISYFFYNIIFNDFVLPVTFNYILYLYIFYNFYKRISLFTAYSCKSNYLIYNMYYRTNTILYANMPKHWEDYVYEYVARGLQMDDANPLHNCPDFFIMEIRHTYCSIDGITYTNLEGHYFIEEKPIQTGKYTTYPYSLILFIVLSFTLIISLFVTAVLYWMSI